MRLLLSSLFVRPVANSSTRPSSTPALTVPDGAVVSRRRWLALDVLRGVAVLLMIQGHTFTALLDPAHYVGNWSRWHSLLHGLTAPMFLLGGGLAYGFVTMRDPTRS